MSVKENGKLLTADQATCRLRLLPFAHATPVAPFFLQSQAGARRPPPSKA